MTFTTSQVASTQTFALGTDSKSASILAGLCGPLAYTIVEGYSFVTVSSATSPGSISVFTNNIADVGLHPTTFKISLTRYTMVPSVQISFAITIVLSDCDASIIQPVSLAPMTFIFGESLPVTQTFTHFTDSTSITNSDPAYCGNMLYLLQSLPFLTLTVPSNQQTGTFALSLFTTDVT
jgi:hypothetical protein